MVLTRLSEREGYFVFATGLSEVRRHSPQKNCTPGRSPNQTGRTFQTGRTLRCLAKAERLMLGLGEMIFFLDFFDLWSGLAFGRGGMQAVFLEHLVEISAVPSGKLRRARDVSAGQLQDILEVGLFKLLLRFRERLELRIGRRAD